MCWPMCFKYCARVYSQRHFSWRLLRPKLILNSTLTKSRSAITSMSVVESFWDFAQSTAVSLPCSVQNFKTIGRLTNKSWTNDILRDLSSRCVFGGYPILQQPQGVHRQVLQAVNTWRREQNGRHCADDSFNGLFVRNVLHLYFKIQWGKNLQLVDIGLRLSLGNQ